MCTPCKDSYADALWTPLKGIDRPEGADEEWRGSILDHLRHAQIAISFAERNKIGNQHDAEPPPVSRDHLESYWQRYEVNRGMTPAQIEVFRNLRARGAQTNSR